MTYTSLTVDEHLTGIEAAAERLVAWSAAGGLDAEVPTCPGWTVRDLVEHQARVHRWALAALGGADLRTTTIEGMDGGDGSDPLTWLVAGVNELLDVLRTAPEDLEAPTFLREAPPARLFWARRQDHETTVHALDALAARDARVPTAADAWFGAGHALDGVDELLVGFWQRRNRGPRAEAGAPYTAEVVPGHGGHWRLEVGEERVTTTHHDAETPLADGADVIGGPPVDVYLALWNRGGAVDDPSGLLDRWQRGGRIG